MKQKVLAIVLAAASTVMLAACGSSSSSSTTSATDAATSGATEGATTAATESASSTEVAGASSDANTLTVWTWDPKFNIYAMQEAEKFYQEDHPDFKLNIVEIKYDDIETKITTAASAGDYSILPDIFLMQDNSYQKYLTYYPDVFLDLTDSGIDFSQFASGKLAYSTMDGKQYGVPFDNGAVICAYRTDYLEAAGLTIDDMTDITWDQFIENGKKVKEATGNCMINSQTGSPDLIMMMLQSAGSSMFNEDGSVNIKDNETLKVAMDYYQQAVEAGVILEVTDWDQYISGLQSGTAACACNGCWIIGSITAAEDQSGKWAITNMPRLDGVDGATNYSNNGGSTWAITTNSKNQDLAIDFMKTIWAGDPDFFADILPFSGALSTWLPAAESDMYSEPQEFFGGDAIYAKITEFASKVPTNITGPYYYDARDAVGVALSNVIQSGADLQTELDTAQETVEFNMGQ